MTLLFRDDALAVIILLKTLEKQGKQKVAVSYIGRKKAGYNNNSSEKVDWICNEKDRKVDIASISQLYVPRNYVRTCGAAAAACCS